MPQPPVADHHLLRFPGTIVGLEGAAAALRALLHTRLLAPGPRYRVELAFDEIGSNILRHARPSGDVEVGILFGNEEIVLTFEDDGIPFNPEGKREAPAPASIDEAPVGGLGLVLVSRIAARMVYERTPEQRNHLTIVISTC